MNTPTPGGYVKLIPKNKEGQALVGTSTVFEIMQIDANAQEILVEPAVLVKNHKIGGAMWIKANADPRFECVWFRPFDPTEQDPC